VEETYHSQSKNEKINFGLLKKGSENLLELEEIRMVLQEGREKGKRANIKG